MTAYIVSMEQIPDLLEAWAITREVLVPIAEPNGFFDFIPWSKGIEIAWDYDLAYNTLKRYFLPPRETLLRFNRAISQAEPIFEKTPRLLLGVHPYDLKAINQLDQLMKLGFKDSHYLKRREQTLVFAMEPLKIADTAFWASMYASQVDFGYDLYWTKISPSTFYVKVGSPQGEELLMARQLLPIATLSEREAVRRIQLNIRTKAFKRSLKFPWEQIPKLLERSWDNSLWRHRSKHCLSCGSCVTVCPTCYCFEVRDEIDLDLQSGKRYREWHGCMLPTFQLVAGDHSFQPLPMDRYRHRYFRKGKYIYDKIGELGCVGCGRCVRACTANIANPMEVFNELWEVSQYEPK
ncbi:sulfhydrogenase subunit beta (sulfur reductase) [Desulfovibrionales bacterium]